MNFIPKYQVRQIENLKDMMEQAVKLFGEKSAFLTKAPGDIYENITYSQFKNDIDALGTAFLSLGLKDKFIAVLGENRYAWCVTYLATVNGTGIVIPLDKELPAAEIQFLLSRSGADAIVYSGKYAEVLAKIPKTDLPVRYFIDMDAGEDGQEVLSLKKLISRGYALLQAGDRSFLDAQIDALKMSMLLFTSGTTEAAKGVMLCHKNICSNITSVRSTVYIDSNDASLSILPLHHTYECTIGFLTLVYSGATIAFNEGLKHIAKNIREVRPTVLVVVPLILENMYKKIWDQAGKKKGGRMLLKTAVAVSSLLYRYLRLDIRRRLFKKIHENLGGRMRLIITGAAAINPMVSRGLRNFGIQVLQGYGLTECSPLATGNRDDAFADASVGLPIPGVQVGIHNPNEIGIGEIVVKGDNVMLGYYQNEAATEKCLKNGWFHTGDLGRVDGNGFYYITGRSKNVIVTKTGKNIYPEEVEAYINRSPLVQESLVWGRQDKVSGETIVNAQIFPNLDAIRDKLKVPSLSAEEISRALHEVVRNVNRNLPIYKHIRDFTIRESDFIKTTTKKIKRHLTSLDT